MPSRLTVLKPGSVNVTDVGARPQIDDSILAGVVADDRADLLDEDRAGGAASPVLIEKVRSVVSDNTGQYRIVDLRPGNYR